jgi:hypothetical protein
MKMCVDLSADWRQSNAQAARVKGRMREARRRAAPSPMLTPPGILFIAGPSTNR